MATYIVKHGGRIVTNLYYGAHEAPNVGDVLTLMEPPQASDPFDAGVTAEPKRVVYKIVGLGNVASGLPDTGDSPEPTIMVEPA